MLQVGRVAVQSPLVDDDPLHRVGAQRAHARRPLRDDRLLLGLFSSKRVGQPRLLPLLKWQSLELTLQHGVPHPRSHSLPMYVSILSRRKLRSSAHSFISSFKHGTPPWSR